MTNDTQTKSTRNRFIFPHFSALSIVLTLKNEIMMNAVVCMLSTSSSSLSDDVVVAVAANDDDTRVISIGTNVFVFKKHKCECVPFLSQTHYG